MNEPSAAKSNAKTVWQQDGDYYKPSVVIHGDDGIGIQVGGHVVTKTAMQWQDLEQQLASEEQQHKIMDAAYWAAKGREADQTAALGALAAGVAVLSEFDPAEIRPKELEHTIQRILAPDAVQQAAKASKAKDAEIEQLKANYAALVLEGTDRDDPTSMVSMIEAAEAKLAEAMGLLQDSTEAMAEWRKYRERPGLPSFNRQEANMWAAQQKADAFLADPSQAVAQYHEAQDVVERVKAAINAREALPEKESNPDIALVLQVLRPLLGDAAQEEQP